MAKRTITETIELTHEDIEQAVSEWLHNHFGPPKPDMQFRPELSSWKVQLDCAHRGDEDEYSAKASRTVG